MAIAPLFLADMDTLKSRLRLSGAAATDALAIIDDVVLQVRMGFYDSLGSARVGQLSSYAHSDTPTSENQISRIKAEVCETSWVRLYLLRRLPSLFVDGSANDQEAFNQEGLTREVSASQLEAELSRLDAEVQGYLSDLAGLSEDGGSLQLTTISPDVTPPRIGQSLWPPCRTEII